MNGGLIWGFVVGTLALCGIAIWNNIEGQAEGRFVVHRAATITELDKGWLLACAQVHNPYPYHEAAVDSLPQILELAKACLEQDARSADRRGGASAR